MPKFPFANAHVCLDCNRHTIPIGTAALPRRCPKCGRQWQYAQTQQDLAGTESEILNEVLLKQGKDTN